MLSNIGASFSGAAMTGRHIFNVILQWPVASPSAFSSQGEKLSKVHAEPPASAQGLIYEEKSLIGIGFSGGKSRFPALAICSLCILTGCASLPSAGPSFEDIVCQSSVAGFDLVSITPAVNAVLAKRRADSFINHFGDYRLSVDPLIGVGDTVSITIWEAAAGGLFSAPLLTDRFSTGSKSATIPEQVVGRDGSITVPYAGRIRVIGQNNNGVQNLIERALEGKAIQPQVLVTVIRSMSNSVTVTGEVVNGARVPLSTKGDRVLDVIASAGGVKTSVSETFIQLTRGKHTARVAMSRVVQDPNENVFMRPDDVLTVIRQPQTFVAFGATGRNSEIPFESESVNLSQALAKAGGLLDSRADPTGVFVLRYEPYQTARQIVQSNGVVPESGRSPIVYHLNLRSVDGMFVAQNFPIFAGDVLYVSNARSTDVEKGLQLLGQLLAPVSASATLYRVGAK